MTTRFASNMRIFVLLALAKLCALVGVQTHSVFAQDAPTDESPEKAQVIKRRPETQGPRFIDQGDGGVLDVNTGLVWFKNPGCLGKHPFDRAKRLVESLSHGFACPAMTLADKSKPGDWRLPDVRELMTLPDPRFYKPALSNAAGSEKWTEDDPFNAVSPFSHWTKTPTGENDVWHVYMYDGSPGISRKSEELDVWPVKGALRNVWRLDAPPKEGR